VTLDREGLKLWYRGAMARRLDELRGLRAQLIQRNQSAFDAARSVAQALRGSGATFGFSHLSAAAAHVEASADGALLRRTDGLIERLRRLATEQGPDADGSTGEWLDLAAGGDGMMDETFSTIEAAWERIATRRGKSQIDLARLVAERYGLRVADLAHPSRAALRLVPEALIRSAGVLPLADDLETITVATSDPTDLELEMELASLTGRTPVFVVASPSEIRRAITALLDVPAPAPEPRGRAPRPDTAEGLPERVLVVDDEPAARLLARSVLEKGGYAVEEAGDGTEALERLGSGAPIDLVVADLNMPSLDGLELIWEMRDEDAWSHVPVIVVTGETDEVLETKLIEEGADDYIRKPLDPRLFLARVAATIRRAEH
jgi:CheY-like chemotaxis protein/HPt (histidine-containing phosphotransfer) domain-containing protein